MTISKNLLLITFSVLATSITVDVQAKRIASTFYTTFWSRELTEADKIMSELECKFKQFENIKARYVPVLPLARNASSAVAQNVPNAPAPAPAPALAPVPTADVSYESALFDRATFAGHVKKYAQMKDLSISEQDLSNYSFIRERMEEDIVAAQIELRRIYTVVDAFEFWTVKAWHSLTTLAPFYQKIEDLENILFLLQARVEVIPHLIKEHDQMVARENEKLNLDKAKIASSKLTKDTNPTNTIHLVTSSK